MAERRSFQFEKWYFDLTLPTGEVIFFFLAKTRIFGWKDARLSLTWTSPRRPPLHESLLLKDGEALLPPVGTAEGGAEVPVRVSGEGLSLDLAFSRHPDDRPAARPMIIPRGRRRILWEPVQGRSLVRGVVRVGDRTYEVDGVDGYIDRLWSDVFPLFTPVKTLYWGRLHHREGSLVYTVVRGPRPRAFLTWNSRLSRLEFKDVDIVEHDGERSAVLGLRYPRSYTLTAGGPSAGVRLDVENVVPAVETAFIGNEKPARALEGRAIDLLGRRPRGVKFFSRGRVRIEDGGRSLEIEVAAFFSEIVRFS